MTLGPMDSLTQADAAACRTTAQSFGIQVFDFLSFDHVHLPFNEGYLRILERRTPMITFPLARLKDISNDWRRALPISPTSHYGPASLLRRHLACPIIIP